jgi:molybdopterin/thiamine biosynthesis adenylyltransferase
MAHLIQVGAGSGGMPVLDSLCQDSRITRVTLIEPDIYKPHNVVRHHFPLAVVGESKARAAQKWLKERRPDLPVRLFCDDLLDPHIQDSLNEAVRSADIGVCAADNEIAKFHWDLLMRRHQKPWTLGEVLSGGIGGFVHWFIPNGPCYGCVASFLGRTIQVAKDQAPDYSQPGGPTPETTVPASKAAIQAIAACHALVTIGLLEQGTAYQPGFSTLLFILQQVPDLPGFEEAFRSRRLLVNRAAECLICGTQLTSQPELSSPEELDVALDQALARLAHE